MGCHKSASRWRLRSCTSERGRVGARRCRLQSRSFANRRVKRRGLEKARRCLPCGSAVLGRAPACPLAWLGGTARGLGDPPVFVEAGPGVRNLAPVLGRIGLASASCCGVLFRLFRAVKKLLAIRTRSTLCPIRSGGCRHQGCAGCHCDVQVRYLAGFWAPTSTKQEPL